MMESKVLLYACFSLFGVFISSVSQVLLKKASAREYSSPIFEYLNPYVICGYTIFIVATLMSVIAYKVVPLSLGPILEATSYIYVTFFGVKIFKEKLNPIKIVALAIIIIGIIIFAI